MKNAVSRWIQTNGFLYEILLAAIHHIEAAYRRFESTAGEQAINPT